MAGGGPPGQAGGRWLGRHETGLVAGGVWVATWAVFGGLVAAGKVPATRGALSTAPAMISTATVTLAVVVAALCVARWHYLASAVDLRIAVAVTLFGVLRVGFSEVVTGEGPGGPSRFATTIGALGLLAAVAFLALPVESGARRALWHRALSPGLMAGLVAVGGLAIVSPAVARIMVGQPPPSLSSLRFVSQLGVCALWLLLGWAYWRSAQVQDRAHNIWFALMFVGLAQSRLALGLGGADGLWVMCSRLLRLEAVLLVAVGLQAEVQHRLVRSEVTVHDLLDARRRADHQAAERHHDVKSALFSVASTIERLERHRGHFQEAELGSLSRALRSEIEGLYRLVGDQPLEAICPLDVRALVSSITVGASAAGQHITVDIEPGTTAMARPHDTAEALRNLLDNARIHAPGSPVRIEGRARNGIVEIIVSDQGPGVRQEEQHAIFERGRRGAGVTASGSGLGLYLARRLLRAQGGDLWLDPTVGGGAAFRVTLQAHEPAELDANAGAARRAGRTMVGP